MKKHLEIYRRPGIGGPWVFYRCGHFGDLWKGINCTENPEEVTCKTCQRLHERDVRKGE